MAASTKTETLRRLNLYKDPAYMKANYGFSINEDQIKFTEALIRKLINIPESEWARTVGNREPTRWPYELTEEQDYDRIMMNKKLPVVKDLLWQNIKQYLINNPDKKCVDADCICAALEDIEQFLMLNVYLGKFEENARILDPDIDPTYTVKLFMMSYRQHLGEKQLQQQYKTNDNNN